jgi:ferrous iron transport protein B
MFFFLSLLEASGYMARAAFVVDKAMRALGLPGKSFVPMIVGFGCNVPAIMAARTLDSERDRLLTVLMSPFMSCSARLAIYAVFVAAFFPVGGQNVVFSLYLIGILMAVLTGFLLRKTLLRGQTSPLILELPAYHKPSLRRLWKDTSLRLRYFILRAGKLIIPVCVILGGLNALTIHGGISTGAAHSESVLSLLGQWLTPIFSPLGLQQDNWPATVGLLSGMLAKEVVVGSLNTLYAQMAHLAHSTATSFDFWGSMQTAVWSIPQNLAKLGSAFMNPILANTPVSDLSPSIYGVMYQHFDGQAGAYAYLLFILLYIPCVSTMAAIRQEASRRLMWFSIIWSFIVAYAVAV